jgi:hypothetical protein
MPRYTPRLPFASFKGGEPELAITNANWKQLENAYGHKLPPKLRKQIYTATWQFLAFSGFESAAQPVAVARKRIQEIERTASKLENTILEIPKGVDKSTAGYADHLINSNFHDSRINPVECLSMCACVGNGNATASPARSIIRPIPMRPNGRPRSLTNT